jgi:hypothetical protein
MMEAVVGNKDDFLHYRNFFRVPMKEIVEDKDLLVDKIDRVDEGYGIILEKETERFIQFIIHNMFQLSKIGKGLVYVEITPTLQDPSVLCSSLNRAFKIIKEVQIRSFGSFWHETMKKYGSDSFFLFFYTTAF